MASLDAPKPTHATIHSPAQHQPLFRCHHHLPWLPVSSRIVGRLIVVQPHGERHGYHTTHTSLALLETRAESPSIFQSTMAATWWRIASPRPPPAEAILYGTKPVNPHHRLPPIRTSVKLLLTACILGKHTRGQLPLALAAQTRLCRMTLYAVVHVSPVCMLVWVFSMSPWPSRSNFAVIFLAWSVDKDWNDLTQQRTK